MAFFKPPGQCPACGEWVPRKAVACDCCGACSRSGWTAESDVYDGVDLPEDLEDFDYDAFMAKEFGPSTARRLLGNVWWWTAVVLLLAMVLAFVLSVWS